ncbi:hypothetical protein FRC17_002040 [Serendipita sp. 399]|nr:hypothetical protein FRC17_002040 [Serendipita sp. 399]
MSISEPLEFRAEAEIVESQISPEDPSTGHNPFRVMLLSSTYVDSKILADDCVEQSPSGMCIRGKDTGYLYSGPTHVFPSPHYRLFLLGCEVAVVEIEYSHLNGSYTADYSTARMADNATTWAINNVLYVSNTRTKFIENALYAFASSGGASSALATLVEEKLARMLLSMSHSAFETTPILRLSGAQQVLATVLPTSALTVFFAFLLGFAAFVVVVAAFSATSSTTAFYVGSHQAPHHGHGHSHGQGGRPELVSEVEVAARQILEPTGLIYKIFEEGTDHQCRWAEDGIEMFVEGQALSHQHRHYAAAGDVRDVKIGLGPNGAFGFQ